MIKRYKDTRISDIWSDGEKFKRWQDVELAVIEAREILEKIPQGTHARISSLLLAQVIDIDYLEAEEAKLKHDLNAFLAERMRFLPRKLGRYFHQKMTSYDTEEPAFALALISSCQCVDDDLYALRQTIMRLAMTYRFTPMLGRTHGQEAEIQSFGKRCLNWYQDLKAAHDTFSKAGSNLRFSKLSGALGTNSGIEPVLERDALKFLGFQPWAGATQIMPRNLYSPLSNALCDLTMTISKIAGDIRLGARSGRPLHHEPFGKSQKGSSAMPHKKNTISSENTSGMARIALGNALSLQLNLNTWEERDIDQSSVERVCWPDLFHVLLRAIKNMTNVMSGLVVYPDNMLREIIESRGTYASNAAKEFLTAQSSRMRIEREDAYRIVQLASFNTFAPTAEVRLLREKPPQSLRTADDWLQRRSLSMQRVRSRAPIQDIIAGGHLRTDPQSAVTASRVRSWNKKLSRLFAGKEGRTLRKEWYRLFLPSEVMANEHGQFKEVFDIQS